MEWNELLSLHFMNSINTCMHIGELHGNCEISDCTTSDVDVNADVSICVPDSRKIFLLKYLKIRMVLYRVGGFPLTGIVGIREITDKSRPKP